MPPKWIPANADHLIERYQAGESVKALADECQISRAAFTGFLSRSGVELRDRSAAMFARMAGTAPAERLRLASAAHDARRGQRDTVETLTRRALTRQDRQLGTSPAELLMAEWLRDLSPIPQCAVGPYNVDLSIGPVSVEIFGGHWHGYDRHARRTPERARYILDSGRLLVIVWVTRKHPIKPAVADYVRSLVEQAERDPSLIGQYRVVWGTGEDATGACPDLDHLALVPTLKRGADAGA